MGAGGGISKRGGSREKWEKFRNISTIFRNRRSTRRREPLWKGREPGVQGAGGSVTVFWVSPCFGYPRTQLTSVLGIPGRDTQNTDSWCEVCNKVCNTADWGKKSLMFIYNPRSLQCSRFHLF